MHHVRATSAPHRLTTLVWMPHYRNSLSIPSNLQIGTHRLRRSLYRNPHGWNSGSEGCPHRETESFAGLPQQIVGRKGVAGQLVGEGAGRAIGEQVRILSRSRAAREHVAVDRN